MNRVILIGNLVKDVELKQSKLDEGKAVVSNVLAVTRTFRKKDGTYDSDFINIRVYGAQAEILDRYCSKGDRIAVVGEWRTGSYEDKQGNKHYTHDCYVSEVQLLSGKKSEPIKEGTKPMENKFVKTNDPFGDDAFDDLPF